jgi:hypothetical protein
MPSAISNPHHEGKPKKESEDKSASGSVKAKPCGLRQKSFCYTTNLKGKNFFAISLDSPSGLPCCKSFLFSVFFWENVPFSFI